jgi:hypothetical protein
MAVNNASEVFLNLLNIFLEYNNNVRNNNETTMSNIAQDLLGIPFEIKEF